MKVHFMRAVLYAVIFFLLSGSYLYSSSVRADPDYVATGIEFRGVPAVKIGDDIGFDRFSIGGMIEVRNEERFNQEALPNHNWRGFVFAYYGLPVFSRGTGYGVLSAGFEHESAHPTMGLNEPASDPHQKIYDGIYRNINMNSFLLRYCHTIEGSYILKLIIDSQFYFASRNTPELPYTDTGWSEGVSGGAEYSFPLSVSWEIFVSVHDRYIFRGRSESRRDVWFSEGGSAVLKNVSYPVINSVNTVTLKTGTTFNTGCDGVMLSVYGSVLYGNIYGFVDSRDKRLQYAIGIELVH